MVMGDIKAVQALLPPLVVEHPANIKKLRIQWDQKCAKILADAPLTADQKIKILMDWFSKAGVRDYWLGKLILSFSRPLPAPPTDEQRKERRQKTLVRLAYHDDLPHLRAVNKVVTNRLDGMPEDAIGSLSDIDKLDERESETPGTMFAEFAKCIEDQVAIEYKATVKEEAEPFADAAQ